MKRTHVQRHPIDSERFREIAEKYDNDLAKYFAGEPPADYNRFSWLARAGQYALRYGSVFAPDAPAIWVAAEASAQGRAGTFAAGTASGRVAVPFGSKTVEIDRNPSFANASRTDWAEGWYCALLSRDKRCLDLLAQVPDEIFLTSRVKGDAYHDAWRAALLTHYRGADPTAHVERALFLSEPAQLKVAAPDGAKLGSAEYHLLLPLFRKDAAGFNQALIQALEVHKKYFDKKSLRESDIGFVALGCTALSALAHEAGIPIEVDSEYLLPALIRGKRA